MTGVEMIAAERTRQIEVEGFIDDVTNCPDGELVIAAMCYAAPESTYGPLRFFKSAYRPAMWPWLKRDWKPTPDDRIRELVKAGALIAAEIDRLQEIMPPKQGELYRQSND